VPQCQAAEEQLFILVAFNIEHTSKTKCDLIVDSATQKKVNLEVDVFNSQLGQESIVVENTELPIFDFDKLLTFQQLFITFEVVFFISKVEFFI
jgi:hypothetical protein